MTARIINRGRGPEIEGTRVTVYRIMDFVREDDTPNAIAKELDLSPDQVCAALDYIAQHRAEVEADYERILERNNQSNPPWVDAGRAASPDELKERILGRQAGVANAHRRGQ